MQHPKPTQRKKNNKKSTKMRTSNDNLTNGVSDLAQENVSLTKIENKQHRSSI